MFFILKVTEDLPYHTSAERLLEDQKGRRCHPIEGGASLLIGLFPRIHLGQEVPVHMWEGPACVSRSAVSDSLRPRGL